MAAIILERVTVQYPSRARPALGPLDLTIQEGECLFVTGANGSGKTTLARLLAGVVHPSEGTVRLNDGREQSQWPQGFVGWVQQNPQQQIIGTTVAEDVALSPLWLCATAAEAAERLQQALDEFNLRSWANYPPHALSGGWQHIAALAAVHAQAPGLVILDEPEAMLDRQGLAQVKSWIDHMRENRRTLMIMGHNRQWTSLADRVLELEGGTIKELSSVGQADDDSWRQFLEPWWGGKNIPSVNEVIDWLWHGLSLP